MFFWFLKKGVQKSKNASETPNMLFLQANNRGWKDAEGYKYHGNVQNTPKPRPNHGLDIAAPAVQQPQLYNITPQGRIVGRNPEFSYGSASHFPPAFIGDAQFLPVLVHGPPGDLDPALREGGADLFIAERLSFILRVDDFPQGTVHLIRAGAVFLRVLFARGRVQEIIHGKDAPGALEVFVLQGAAYSGLVKGQRHCQVREDHGTPET